MASQIPYGKGRFETINNKKNEALVWHCPRDAIFNDVNGPGLRAHSGK